MQSGPLETPIDYLILPNTEPLEVLAGEYVIIMPLAKIIDDVLFDENTSSFQFIIKARGYNDVTLNFDIESIEVLEGTETPRG